MVWRGFRGRLGRVGGGCGSDVAGPMLMGMAAPGGHDDVPREPGQPVPAQRGLGRWSALIASGSGQSAVAPPRYRGRQRVPVLRRCRPRSGIGRRYRQLRQFVA